MAAKKTTTKKKTIKKTARKTVSTGAKNLVIVESPAKARTINKYLGKDFEVTASGGHVVDLPKSRLGIDLEKDFEPSYIVIVNRKKIVSELKRLIKNKENLYLAPDPDREGEAISFHLANLLGAGKNVFRVSFNEITAAAVHEAFEHPRDINQELVNAQQARRVLDRIVGYTLSPLLWRKVGRGLSAGRVQSVALRIVVEREREIRAFVPEEYWQIEALLAKQNPPEGGEEDFRLRATLEKMNGEKINVADQENAAKIVADLEKATYKISDVQEKQRRRTPQPPFTTSKLQQDSFNRLRFPASKTMRIAQQLYEGVDLGAQGSVGLITYMRTDSVRVADSAVEEVRAFIRENCGEKYLPKSANKYKSGKKAQEAHEAIRPTSVTYTPDAVKPFLDVNQFKLYELIWRRFVASQMTPAVFLQTAVDIEADIYGLRSRGSVMLFDGFLKVYQEARDNDEILPKVEKGEVLDLIKLKPSQHFTKPPPRFTDASLVKVLEEKGIGRPSTYAPTIQTVVDRGYVRRDGGSLVPCELGETVIDLLIEHFSKVVDEGFTAEMEEEFDRVEEGSLDWVQVVREFYEPYSAELGEAKENMRAVRAEVEEMDEKCPDCGRPLVKKWGRGKKFISCSGFPDCKYARPITSGVPCPEEGCEGELVERWSRRGAFFGCSRFPTCRHISKELPKSDANAG